MNDLTLRANCQVIPCARERYYKNNSNTAILLIHGYTGTPADMDYLAHSIYNETGFTIFVPRLPGHGTRNTDFRQCKARDWFRKVFDSYLNLKERYKNVYPGGLSIGGLLSILLSANFNVKKLFLIAPALYSHIKVISLSHILQYIKPVIKSRNKRDRFKDKEDYLLYQNYWKKHYIKQVAELHKLMRLARKKLASVKANTLIICSRKDELVPMKAAYTVKKRLASVNKKLVVFDKSPHLINNGPERESCAREIIKFLLD